MSGLVVKAYLYKPEGLNSFVTTDKKTLNGETKKEDWEEISLVIPKSNIEFWSKALEKEEEL